MSRLADKMLASQEGPPTPGVNSNNNNNKLIIIIIITMSARLKDTSTSERSKTGLASLHPA
jgi:hypothetical protein